ncbi:hypothetical protein [Aporhodopirellula aestuarii]|uniref:Uncharacterized protein n=1 Tax=Aporhodopirellula aestuarii TaxID=2950107 RepID=A0ABT0UCE8_9BACT|nr:hypothetical protein [Aporhodopirellula aestuarii]MCM2374155.1 hypothetical protein [Aporhodopirellula aestuarii]
MKQLNITFSNPIDFYLLEKIAELDIDGKPTIYAHAQGIIVVLRGAEDWDYISWEVDAADKVNIYGDYPEFGMSRGNDKRLKDAVTCP